MKYSEHRKPSLDPKPHWDRACICCREQFSSEGKHNRMYDTCRKGSTAMFEGSSTGRKARPVGGTY